MTLGINWGARWRVHVAEEKSERDNHLKEEDRPGKRAEGGAGAGRDGSTAREKSKEERSAEVKRKDETKRESEGKRGKEAKTSWKEVKRREVPRDEEVRGRGNEEWGEARRGEVKRE